MGRPPHSETYPQPSKCNHRPKIDGVCIAWLSNEQSIKQQRDHPNAESNYRRSHQARHVSNNKFEGKNKTNRRSEERRVGKECVSTGRTRWTTNTKKKKKKKK